MHVGGGVMCGSGKRLRERVFLLIDYMGGANRQSLVFSVNS